MKQSESRNRWCTTMLLMVGLLFLSSIQSQAQDTMQLHPSAQIQSHSGAQVSIFGDLKLNSSFGSATQGNKGILYFSGHQMQSITGDSVLQFDSVVVNSQGVNLSQALKIAKHLEFQNGRISTNRADSLQAFVHFLAGSAYSGESDSSHVNGSVYKTGNTAFVFPIGHLNNLQPIAISAPSSATDEFLAFYRQENASSYLYSTQQLDSNCGGSPLMVDITEKEFWHLERMQGSSSVQVELYYDSSSGVNTPAELLVARWNGTKWESLGNGGVTGSSQDGTLLTGSGCGSPGAAASTSVFGPFTIGATSQSAVPIDLLSFEVQHYKEGQALLEWITASELNNSHFEIQRSINGLDFETIGTLPGAGTSYDLRHYSYIDNAPYIGLNYYRVKQIDFDGAFSFTPIRSLDFTTNNGRIKAYPIPAHQHIFIDLSTVKHASGPIIIQLFDATGKLLISEKAMHSRQDYKLALDHLPAGMYLLTVGQNNLKLIKQ